MSGDNLQTWIEQWQRGDGRGLGAVYLWLWRELFPVPVGFLRKFVPPSEARELAEEAFWLALEELDLMVSGGVLLTSPMNRTKQIIQSDGTTVARPVFIGQVSRRELMERKRFQWLGEKEFRSLFRDLWIYRCQTVLQKRKSNANAWPSSADTVKDPGDVGFLVTEEIMDRSPSPERMRILREQVLEWAEALSSIALQMREQEQGALAQIMDALNLYIKREVAKAHPNADPLHLTELENQPLSDLLAGSDGQALDFSSEVWPFVQDTLKLNAATLYQRKRRLFAYLEKRKPLPGPLQGGFGLLWLRDMKDEVADCVATRERLKQQGLLREAQALQAIEFYLRWTFAQGHPSHVHADRAWVKSAAPSTLFKVNNPALLRCAFPGAESFRQFVKDEYNGTRHEMAALSELRVGVQGLDPRPIRLVSLVNILDAKA